MCLILYPLKNGLYSQISLLKVFFFLQYEILCCSSSFEHRAGAVHDYFDGIITKRASQAKNSFEEQLLFRVFRNKFTNNSIKPKSVKNDLN